MFRAGIAEKSRAVAVRIVRLYADREQDQKSQRSSAGGQGAPGGQEPPGVGRIRGEREFWLFGHFFGVNPMFLSRPGLHNAQVGHRL